MPQRPGAPRRRDRSLGVRGVILRGFVVHAKSSQTQDYICVMAAELTANDFTVLALIAERPTHGRALAAQVARGAPIGTIWDRPADRLAHPRQARAGRPDRRRRARARRPGPAPRDLGRDA